MIEQQEKEEGKEEGLRAALKIARTAPASSFFQWAQTTDGENGRNRMDQETKIKCLQGEHEKSSAQ